MYAHVRSCYTPPAYAAARAVIKPDSLTVPRCTEPSGLAALLLVRLAARSRTVLDSWHLALFTRAADLSSLCAINFHMLPRSRPLAEGVAAAPPWEPLSALACQRKHARISDDQWRPRATASISGARAVCALLNGAMFNIEHRTVAVLRSGIARRAVRVGGVRALCAPPTRARGARRLRQTTARARRLCAVCNCI